jgi:hypothetical protein
MWEEGDQVGAGQHGQLLCCISVLRRTCVRGRTWGMWEGRDQVSAGEHSQLLGICFVTRVRSGTCMWFVKHTSRGVLGKRGEGRDKVGTRKHGERLIGPRETSPRVDRN